jgi:AcrR family transcriptional regulator
MTSPAEQRKDMAVTSRSRGRSTEGRRTELIDAALRVLARDGVSAATTRKIADEAGLPLGTVHYWFAGKDDLMEAVVTSVLDRFGAALDRATTAGESGTLLESFRAAWSVVENDDPGAQLALYELTTLSMRTPTMRDLARRQYSLYLAIAKRSTDAWIEATGAELPGGPEAVAQLCAVVFDGVELAWLADPGGWNPDEVFVLLSHLLSTAAARPEPAS